MFLMINNISPERIFLGLSSNDKIISKKEIKLDFFAGEKLLGFINDFLKSNKIKINDLEGLIVNQGPGSFTSLRITALLANTWAYARKIPLYPFPATDFLDINKIFTKLKNKKAVYFFEPDYGAPPKITKPKSRG